MGLSKKDLIEFELSGFGSTKWQTSSEIGTQISQGQSGRDPKTGKLIKTPGTSENRPLSLTKVYDPSADKAFIDLLQDESPQGTFRNGKLKGTLIFYGLDGTVEAKYVLSGLSRSSYSLPGIDYVGKGFGMLTCEFEYETIKQY